MADTGNTEVATTKPTGMTLRGKAGETTVSPQELRELSFEELSRALGVVDATEAIGTDQFGPILEDKSRLVGVPFILVYWKFYQGDMGEFASMGILTQSGDRYIVNDGSTGICAQLRELTDKQNIDAMVACKHGFRFSDYTFTAADGTEKPARTYYIDTKL